MISYKDMTFCTFYTDCACADKCPRPLTEQVRREAAKWWGNQFAPISQFTEKPDCHEKIREGGPK